MHPGNPLDLTTQPIWQPELVGIGAKTLLDDPAIGSLVISITVGGPAQSVLYIKGLIKALEGNKKPVVFSILGDRSPLAPEFLELAREHRIILSRSSERSLRAMAQVTAYGKHLAIARSHEPAKPFAGLPPLGHGPQPEWLGKKVLAAAGIAIPAGALARSVDEAVETARPDRLSGCPEGAGRDPDAQDRSRRRAAQYCRRGGAAARPGRP